MLTKRDIITRAFEELGLGAYQYDLQPEDLNTAVRRLDSLMAKWAGYGIETGYPLSMPGDTNTIDQEIGLITQLIDGASCALAISLAPQYGKQPSPETRREARNGFVNGLRLASVPPQKAINVTNVPAGAGYKHRDLYKNLNNDGPDEIYPDQEGRLSS